MRNESPVILISAVIKGSEPRAIATDRIMSLAYEDSDTKSDKLTLTVLNHDLAAFDSKERTIHANFSRHPGNQQCLC